MHIVDVYFNSRNQAQPLARPTQTRGNVEKLLWHLFEEAYSEKFPLDIKNNPYHIYLSPNETCEPIYDFSKEPSQHKKGEGALSLNW